ncbi:hypothetical protein CP973_21625 [Streptomyces albofaciens JCM 4342]|nr:hypothetical protein CP973_21625 [Streptomyces albofaciens JCM 4342]
MAPTDEPVPTHPKQHPRTLARLEYTRGTADSARSVAFPPRELRELQLRVCAEQQRWSGPTAG